MHTARVVAIHRYPVKSMQGESLESVAVAADGLRGDRAYATRDEARGGIEGARKLPALLSCQARFTETVGDRGPLPIPEIEFPDGSRIRADDVEVAKRLSELCGRELSLWPRRPAGDAEHYKRGAPDHSDLMTELRSIFARQEDEPLPNLGDFPPEILTSSTLPGTYFDVYPLFLLTETALATLQRSRPASRFDVRRFRPNLLLASDASGGIPENAWIGKRLRVGGAVFDVAMECPRCLMTTHAFADLPKDPGVMRALVAENRGNLGVYASVVEPGVVRTGDSVELLA